MDYQHSRRIHLLRHLKSDEVEGYLVTDPVNVTYLTGCATAAAALLTPAGTTVLTDDPAEPPAGVTFHPLPPGAVVDVGVGELLRAADVKAVGVEAGHLTLARLDAAAAAAPKVALKPTGPHAERLRAVKDPAEVESARTAARVADRGQLMLVATMRETDTEKDLADALEGYLRRAGGRGAGGPLTVALGGRGAYPGGHPSAATLSDVSKVLLDWGAETGGCQARMARAFRSPFNMLPTRKSKYERTGHDFERVHAAVAAAYAAMVAEVRHGNEIALVAKAGADVLTAAGLGEFAPPELGHGVGMTPRELPYMRADAAGELASGMVLFVAPAVRIPEWGGVRVGNTLLVTRTGCQELTAGVSVPGTGGPPV